MRQMVYYCIYSGFNRKNEKQNREDVGKYNKFIFEKSSFVRKFEIRVQRIDMAGIKLMKTIIFRKTIFYFNIWLEEINIKNPNDL